MIGEKPKTVAEILADGVEVDLKALIEEASQVTDVYAIWQLVYAEAHPGETQRPWAPTGRQMGCLKLLAKGVGGFTEAAALVALVVKEWPAFVNYAIAMYYGSTRRTMPARPEPGFLLRHTDAAVEYRVTREAPAPVQSSAGIHKFLKGILDEGGEEEGGG